MIYQIRGFYGQEIDIRGQKPNSSTLTGVLVAGLLIMRVNLHIFMIKAGKVKLKSCPLIAGLFNLFTLVNSVFDPRYQLPDHKNP